MADGRLVMRYKVSKDSWQKGESVHNRGKG